MVTYANTPTAPGNNAAVPGTNPYLNPGQAASGAQLPAVPNVNLDVLPSSPLAGMQNFQFSNPNITQGFEVPQFAPTQVNQLAAPNIPNLQDLIGNVNQAQAQLPGVDNYLPQIQALGQSQVDLFKQSLAPLFAQQNEQAMERIAQQGLIGAGGENEILRRLAGEQTQYASQGIGEILNQNQQLQISEMQRARDIDETRRQQLTDVATQLGINSAELESRHGLAFQELSVNADIADKNRQLSAILDTQANNLRAAGLETEAANVRNQALGLQVDALSKDLDAQFALAEIKLKERGQMTDIMAQDLDEYRTALDFLLKLASQPGLSDGDRAGIIANAKNLYDDFVGQTDSGTTTFNAPSASDVDIQSRVDQAVQDALRNERNNRTGTRPGPGGSTVFF